MKSRVVKFPTDSIFSYLESWEGFRLSSYESKKKNLDFGKVTLSLKKGKRRKLVKGVVRCEIEYLGKNFEAVETFYFTPNNRAKFLSVFQTS